MRENASDPAPPVRARNGQTANAGEAGEQDPEEEHTADISSSAQKGLGDQNTSPCLKILRNDNSVESSGRDVIRATQDLPGEAAQLKCPSLPTLPVPKSPHASGTERCPSVSVGSAK